MIRAALLLAVAILGCGRGAPQVLTLGAHRVRLVAPGGWEHLDRGRTQIYQRGDDRISLLDFGAAPDSVDAWIELARERTEDTDRMEIASSSRRLVHGVEWVRVETWDRVTHADRRVLACAEAGRDLIVLSLDRGDLDHEGRTFEEMLGSIEVLPPAAP